MSTRLATFVIALGTTVSSFADPTPSPTPSVPPQFVAEWKMEFPGSVGFADLHANYPGHYFKVDPSLEMVIQGEYPHCRYFSLVAYDAANLAIAALHDSEIAPDPGSVNPFLPGADWNASQRRYTVIVRFTPPPAGEGPAVVRGGQAARGNIVYAGLQADGKPNPAGLLAYRRYLPSQGYDVKGGVPMPLVYYRRVADGTLVKPMSPARERMKTYGLILPELRKALAELKSAKQKLKSEPTPAGLDQALVWRRSPQAFAENPETVYLVARVKPEPGQVLVLRWKAPTFPDTFHGRGLTGREDVRYWSMCFASARTITKFSLADAEAVIGADGYVNFVVGFGAKRPARATAENGYTWVDLKGKPISYLLYRNMVPSSDFHHLANQVPAGEAVTDQIGEYLPKGRWIKPEGLK
jgi:hypothetical protein